jgi:hypothetical protein
MKNIAVNWQVFRMCLDDGIGEQDNINQAVIFKF